MRKKLLTGLVALLFLSVQGYTQCSTPTNLSVIVVDGSTTTLSWDAMGGSDSYKVNVQEASGNPVNFLFETTVSPNSYTISGLTEGSNYKFKVRSNCGGDHSDWSEFFFFTSGVGPTVTQCDIATGLMASNITTTSADLSWDVMENAIKYRIRIEDGQGNPNPLSLNVVSTTNAYTISGLLPGLNYKFKVRTVCGQSIKSNFSEYVTFTTAPQKLSEISAVLQVKAYPNPVTNDLTVNIPIRNQEGLLQMIDLTGQVVFTQNISAEAQLITLPVSNLPQGLYHLAVRSGEQVSIQKIQVIR